MHCPFILHDYCFSIDLRGSEKCLKEEGMPDVCLNFFKTGEGSEKCNSWSKDNHTKVIRSEARLKKCVDKPTTNL